MEYRFVKKIFKIQTVHPHIHIEKATEMDLILASTSTYRHSLLKRLQIPFRAVAPLVDETAQENEAPEQLVARLALAKARAVSGTHADALVIGSDQVATMDGKLIGKPGDHQTATAQLRACSGREVQFLTGLALTCENTGFEQVHVEPFTVYFRELSDSRIENYLQREQPYDCAGSFKCEGLGIALFSSLCGDDPTALEGLPLISLVNMLELAGINPLN